LFFGPPHPHACKGINYFLAEEEKEPCDSDSPVTGTLYLLFQDLLALTYILREKRAERLESRKENEI